MNAAEVLRQHQWEEWRDIPGHLGYQVSNIGRIRSRRVSGSRSGRLQPDWRLITIQYDRQGYPKAVLFYRGRGAHMRVHVAVAEAFLGPRPPGMVVRHLDDNKDNSAVENLAWGTASDNYYDRVRNGIHHEANKTHCPQGHPYDEANTRMCGRKRYCRTCSRARDRARYWRIKAAADAAEVR